jgi:hypothetical protein
MVTINRRKATTFEVDVAMGCILGPLSGEWHSSGQRTGLQVLPLLGSDRQSFDESNIVPRGGVYGFRAICCFCKNK